MDDLVWYSGVRRSGRCLARFQRAHVLLGYGHRKSQTRGSALLRSSTAFYYTDIHPLWMIQSDCAGEVKLYVMPSLNRRSSSHLRAKHNSHRSCSTNHFTFTSNNNNLHTRFDYLNALSSSNTSTTNAHFASI